MTTGIRLAAAVILFSFVAIASHAAGSPQAVPSTNPQPAAAGSSQSAAPSQNSGDNSPHDAPVWVSDFIAAVALVVSVINIIYIVSFTNKSNADRTRERQEDRNERQIKVKRDVSSFWIQDLILKPSNDLMHDFFNEYEQKLSVVPATIQAALGNIESAKQIATQAVNEFKAAFYQVNKRVVEPLIFVSPDFTPLEGTMNEIEDLVTNAFDSVHLGNGNHANCVLKFAELRAQFFHTVHSVHKSITGVE